MTENIIVEFQRPERKFVKVYTDFLDNDLLTCEERMVFITLRSFVDFAHDEAGTVYPTMETICKRSGLSRPRATRTIDKLIRKGVVQKYRRGLTMSNVYTLIDNPEIWSAGSDEEMRQEATKTELQKHIEAVEAAGYQVLGKEKELPPTGIDESPSKNTDTIKYQSSIEKGNTDSDINQSLNSCSSAAREEYPLESLKAYFEYKSIHADEETKEAIFNILHNVLNSGKPKIKVAGEMRPAAIVKSRIMKLSCNDIQYVIEKYIEYGRAGNRIKNPEAFILTQLFKAKEQAELEIQNDLNVDGY